MTKKIAIALIAAVLIALGVGLLLPRSWDIERSIVIDAAPERIAPFVLDLRRWQEWSVWTKALDPLVRNTFEGPADGVGAKWLWLGPTMGRGRIEIVAADPRRGIELDQALESERVNSHGTIAFSADGSSTKVTWIDRGELPLLGGFFRSSFEERLGDDLEKSLAKLKTAVDALPPAAPQPIAPGDAGVELDAGTP